jgi:glycosyltransferase involved in cell wall biosynthesis
MDFVDVISKGLERRADKSNLFWRLALQLEYRRVLEYEKKVFRDFNESIIISAEDRRFLPFEGKNRVTIIPNGIDTSIFVPQECPKEYDLFFSGNLSYPPNIDAAKYIVKRILPLLKEKIPNITVLIAGASPTRDVRKLGSENVTIKGWIDDIREYYKRARIFIAPMQIGTGLQNKLLQAMAMKLPCVVSELAGKGFSNGGKNSIVIARNPEEYVAHIVDLLRNDEYATKVSQAGYEYIKTYHSWDIIISDLESIFQSVVHK